MFKQLVNGNKSWQLFSRKSSYNKLLITLILIFFFDHILTGNVGRTILAISFLLASLWQINTLGFSKSILFIFRNIAIAAFLLNLVPYFFNDSWLVDFATVSSMLLYLLFIALAILAISSRIFSEKKVDKELIKGGICVFLMLGLFWSLLYKITVFFFPESFNYPADENFKINFLYFSFTTLTTLGYGDITPASPIARALTNAEAIVGQLYPSISIARLVALWQYE